MPDHDPGEYFADINMQIFGLGGTPGGPETMDGFVDNYMRQAASTSPYDPKAIMHYFTPTQLPVISRLATAFGVSDRWYASAPCETWPNRYFAHCGTAGGWVNNESPTFPYVVPRLLPTIFRRLGRHARSWNIYFHDAPQAATLVDLWIKIPTHFRLFEDFLDDAADGKLPNYSFIEPRYYPNPLLSEMPNDEHPPHNIVHGEQLIAATYNAVRRSPNWAKTLLVVTFDEHGGCYDHAPPPPAVPPGPPYTAGFRYDRYGIRVPAALISPYMPAGSIIRPPGPSDGQAWRPFDHTSIIATLERMFDLGASMTPRVATAPDLLSALTLERPENGGPELIEAPAAKPSRDDVGKLARARRNHHQMTLRHPVMRIPGLMAQAAGHIGHAGRRLRRRRSTS